MKNLVHIIAVCLVAVTTFVGCKQSKIGNNDDAQQFDSIFGNLLAQSPAKAYAMTDSLLCSTDDSCQYYYILSYQAISRLAQNSDVKSFARQSQNIESYLNRNIEDSLCPKWRVTKRNVLKFKGLVYHHQKMMDSSMFYLSQVPNYELPKQLPMAYLNLADSYNQSGQYVKGAEMSRHAMQANDSLGKPVPPELIYLSLGFSYLKINEFDQAKLYFDKSRDFLNRMTEADKYILANNYGNLYYYIENYNKALKYFKLAYNHAKNISYQSIDNIVPVYNLAEIYILLNEPDSAKMCLDGIDKTLKGYDIPVFREHLLTLKLAYNLICKNYPSAKAVIDNMQKDILPIDLHIIRDKYVQEYYEKTGGYKDAYRLSQINRQLGDSLHRKADKSKIADIYLRYKQDTTIIAQEKRIAMKEGEMQKNRIIWIFIVIVTIIGAVSIYLRMRRQRTEMIRKHMEKLIKIRMENVRNCLTPHFSFNIINHEIENYHEDDPHRKNLISLCKILRRSVEATDKITQTLAEELEFVNAYIQLETNSWNDFEYKLNIADGIDIQKITIPTMFIQIPVENAIKHGLKGVDGCRRLHVTIEKNSPNITIVIENNGLTYQPKMITSNTGTGLKVIYQTILFLNSIKSDTVHFHIGQGTMPGSTPNRAGTKVMITIPTQFDYSVLSPNSK